MIRKLQIKFVAMCMLLVTAVLGVVFLAVFLSAKQNIEIISRQVLQRVIEEDYTVGRPDLNPGGEEEVLLPYFTVNVWERSGIYNAYVTGGTYADCAKVIKSQLAAIGIDATIEELEEGAWVEKVFAGNYDMCMMAGFQGPDPDNMTNRVGTGGGLNVSFYSNTEVDDLLAKARVITDETQRGEYYKEVQTILSQDLPILPLVEYAGYYACPSYISGLPYIDTDVDDINAYNFSKVTINK